MSTSQIKTYITNITPAKNALVDDLATYLSACTKPYEDLTAQYQKIDLDMTIKITADQSKLVDGTLGNYLSIYQDSKYYYYFILGCNWKAEKTAELELSIDSINTFRNDFEFTDKTNIIRQHKSRFLSSDRLTLESNNTLHQVVDTVDEGISPALMIKDSVNSETISDSTVKAAQNWYLVYQEMIKDESSKPLEVFLLPKNNNVPYGDEYSLTVTWYPSSLVEGVYYYFPDEGICYKYKDATTISKYKFDINDGIIQVVASPIDETATVVFTSPKTYYIGANNVQFSTLFGGTQYLIKAGQSGTAYLDNIDTIDRSNTSITSIIELPYLPSNITWSGNTIQLSGTGWEMQENKLHLINYTSEFERTIRNINIPLNVSLTLEDTFNIDKNKTLESKMKHSSLYNFKLNYDSYSSEIALERINRTGNTTPSIAISFKPSNNLSSDLMYHWTFSNGTYKEIQDYETYISSTRNNQLGLYTSEYLNYQRVGYNYDRKSITRNEAVSWIGTGLSIAGAIASVAVSAGTGGISAIAAYSLTATAITSLVNAISNTYTQEQTFANKLEQYKQQSTSVSNASAIDLLNWYNGNKLHKLIYKPTEQMQDALYDLFFYCGYAVNNRAVPDTTSRYWFNYIQCEPDFKPSTADTYNKFLDDIKARYSAGVTVYHNNNGWDWEQQYENWENFLLD